MYGTLANWREYALARGLSASVPSDDAVASAALVRASDYIKYSYVSLFVGGADDQKPEVELATYEVAFIEASTPGFFSKTYTPDQQKVLVGVDSLRWQVAAEYTGRGAGSGATPVSTKVEAMLRQYMPGKYAIGLQSIGGGSI